MSTERKTRLAAKLAVQETNQPGFVNEGPYYNDQKPRKPFVELPCAYLEQPADALWKRDANFREDVSYEARRAMEHYRLVEMNLYDNDGNILEVIVNGETVYQGKATSEENAQSMAIAALGGKGRTNYGDEFYIDGVGFVRVRWLAKHEWAQAEGLPTIAVPKPFEVRRTRGN